MKWGALGLALAPLCGLWLAPLAAADAGTGWQGSLALTAPAGVSEEEARALQLALAGALSELLQRSGLDAAQVRASPSPVSSPATRHANLNITATHPDSGEELQVTLAFFVSPATLEGPALEAALNAHLSITNINQLLNDLGYQGYVAHSFAIACTSGCELPPLGTNTFTDTPTSTTASSTHSATQTTTGTTASTVTLSSTTASSTVTLTSTTQTSSSTATSATATTGTGTTTSRTTATSTGITSSGTSTSSASASSTTTASDTSTDTTTPHTTTDTSTTATATGLWSVEGSITLNVPSGASASAVAQVSRQGLARVLGQDSGVVEITSAVEVAGASPSDRRLQGTSAWQVGFEVVGSGGGLVLPAAAALTSADVSVANQQFGPLFEAQGWSLEQHGGLVAIEDVATFDWSVTTATRTTTTCCVCPLPDFGSVPVVDLAVDGPSDATSREPGLLRVECEGKFPGDVCRPACERGWLPKGGEPMRCNVTGDEGYGQFEGTVACERTTCDAIPVWQGQGPGSVAHCPGKKHEDLCAVQCDSGYESSGVDQSTGAGGDILFLCNNTVHQRLNPDLSCVEASCWAHAIPSISHAGDNSHCAGTPSGSRCSPTCEDGFVAVGNLTCTKGVFFSPPEVCVPKAQLHTVEKATVYQFELAIAAAGLSVEPGESARERLASSLGRALELNRQQVFITEIGDLFSSWDTMANWQLAVPLGSEGLHLQFFLRPYPRDLQDDAGDALLQRVHELGSTGSAASASLLSDLAGAAPAAIVVVSPFRDESNQTYPMRTARWVARSEWSGCSTSCGQGKLQRDVHCETGVEDLCNANAPPLWTKEGIGLDDEADCEWYGGCGYDWRCPAGVDSKTGVCAVGQEEAVMATIGVSSVLSLLLCCQYCRVRLRQPHDGVCRIRVETHESGGMRRKVKWSRHSPGEDQQDRRDHIHWDLEDDFFQALGFAHLREPGVASLAPFTREQLAARERGDRVEASHHQFKAAGDMEHGHCAIVMSRSSKLTTSWSAAELGGGRVAAQLGVDLDLSGRNGDFELSVEVVTTAMNGFIVGKCFRGSRPAEVTGCSKTLVVRDGLLTLQVGDAVIVGSTSISDGQMHEVGFGFSAERGGYFLLVDRAVESDSVLPGPVDDADGSEPMKGDSREGGASGASQIVGMCGELGFDLIQEEHPQGRPFFLGDIDGMVWREQRQSPEKAMWATYHLRIGSFRSSDRKGSKGSGANNRTNYRLCSKSAADEEDTWDDIRELTTELTTTATDTSPAEAHHAVNLEAKMEYFSKTNNTWVQCIVTSSSYAHALPWEQCYRPARSLARLGGEGEMVTMPTYTVYVGLAHSLFKGTALRELRPLFNKGEKVSFFSQRGRRWLKGRVHGEHFARATLQGYSISLLGGEHHHAGLHASGNRLDGVPPQLLRPRFEPGERVEVYRGLHEGWVEAHVVRELDDAEPPPPRDPSLALPPKAAGRASASPIWPSELPASPAPSATPPREPPSPREPDSAREPSASPPAASPRGSAASTPRASSAGRDTPRFNLKRDNVWSHCDRYDFSNHRWPTVRIRPGPPPSSTAGGLEDPEAGDAVEVEAWLLRRGGRR